MPFYLDKFVLFGASIIQFSSNPELDFSLAGALQHDYQRKLDVVTRGFSGYNSDHGKKILPLLIQEENKGRGKVKAIAIWLGSNDAANNEQYVPLDRFKANLRHMIGLCNDNGIKVIIVGVALHDEVHYSDEGVNPRNTMQNLEYSNAAKQVADELGAQFIDMWHGMLDYLGWKQNENEPIVGQLPKETQDPKKLEMLLDLLSDGLHPTGKGYKILYNGIVKAIEHHWPELTPEAIPTLLPSSEEIYEDPSKLDNALE